MTDMLRESEGWLFVHVPGIPRPQGSKTMGWTSTGKPYMRDASNQLKEWRTLVSGCAKLAMNECGHRTVESGPVGVDITFRFKRPKNRPQKEYWKTTTPDLDKLIRGILDALSGVCYADDKQVCDLRSRKTYNDESSCTIIVTKGVSNA